MTKEAAQRFRDAVNKWRAEKGYSISTLAAAINLKTPQQLANILNGNDDSPSAFGYLSDLVELYKIKVK